MIAEVLQNDGVAEGGESQVIQHLNIMTLSEPFNIQLGRSLLC